MKGRVRPRNWRLGSPFAVEDNPNGAERRGAVPPTEARPFVVALAINAGDSGRLPQCPDPPRAPPGS